jgi:PhzF family phenazine biosynthesis protein
MFPFYRINAFTNYHFSGNPASVVLLENSLATTQFYTNIASEMSTPETAFLLPISETDTSENHQKDEELTNYEQAKIFSLRWFMATHEVKMCGHATLAAAYVLFYEVKNCHNSIIFKTLSGNITAKNLGNGKIALDFPADNFETFIPSNNFLDKIGITSYKAAAYSDSRNLAIIAVESLSVLQDLQMNFEVLKNHQELNIKKLALTTNNFDTIIATNNANQIASNYDFISRCFCPWIGINEDALSAASHTLLAKFWANYLHKTNFMAFQASKRTGELQIIMKSDNRMDLIGESYLSLKGNIFVE